MSAVFGGHFLWNMKKAVEFIKGNAVLVAAFAAALISMFFVPPSAAYLEYIDFSVIILLFCLMAAVAGLRSLGVFDALSSALLAKTGSARIIAFILMNLCFFLSMLVTNDVALITFVPLTLGLYAGSGMTQQLIMTIVIETAAANLGSMITPIGNPQNLFLFKHYSMSGTEFISAVWLLGVISYALLCFSVLLVKRGEVSAPPKRGSFSANLRFFLYAAVFLLCVLSVAGLVSEYICLAAAVAVMLIADYKLFAKVDYSLLLTFVCFFVFVGNIGSIDAVRQLAAQLIQDRELVVSALLSQIISNVPAAAMLSGFTENSIQLLRGVNIGGLGTPVASLASLISYRFYASSDAAQKGRYMRVFLVFNVVMLAIMLAAGIVIS